MLASWQLAPRWMMTTATVPDLDWGVQSNLGQSNSLRTDASAHRTPVVFLQTSLISPGIIGVLRTEPMTDIMHRQPGKSAGSRLDFVAAQTHPV